MGPLKTPYRTLSYKQHNCRSGNQNTQKIIMLFLYCTLSLFAAQCYTSATYAIKQCSSVCVCVCLSVTFVHSVKTSTHILRLFSPSGSHTIVVFPHQTGWQYFDRDPLTGASNARGYEKSRFSTNISLYLRIDARENHSYYGRQIGN